MFIFVSGNEVKTKKIKIMDLYLTAIINRIEFLESKEDSGTITMDESTELCNLTDKAIDLINE